MSKVPQWTLPDLQTHLQFAVDLEFWTIPFYMSAMYSVVDPAATEFQWVQTVVHQEMLHLQLAANLANAFGLSPTFAAPVYEGQAIPHLDFKDDHPDPARVYRPYSAEIGPLDLPRANAMCLIEFPEWQGHHAPHISPEVTEYGSIGEFYAALRVGVTELCEQIRGGHQQVDMFARFYRWFPQPTITEAGAAGLPQVLGLIDAITSQGEGEMKGDTDVPTTFQNSADDAWPSWSHYRKFQSVRKSVLSVEGPVLYSGQADPAKGSPGYRAQEILMADFIAMREALTRLLGGQEVPDFGPIMVKIGGSVRSCWQHDAIPRFS